MMSGKFLSNDDLQRMITKEALAALKMGNEELSDYLSKLSNALETLKDWLD